MIHLLIQSIKIFITHRSIKTDIGPTTTQVIRTVRTQTIENHRNPIEETPLGRLLLSIPLYRPASRSPSRKSHATTSSATTPTPHHPFGQSSSLRRTRSLQCRINSGSVRLLHRPVRRVPATTTPAATSSGRSSRRTRLQHLRSDIGDVAAASAAAAQAIVVRRTAAAASQDALRTGCEEEAADLCATSRL